MKKALLASLTPALLLFGLFLVLPEHSPATTEYARETKLACSACHRDPTGGGPLTGQGQRFLDELKAQGRYQELSPVRRIVRLILGYLHMMAAIMWFGTILYVHLLLKPAYASKGLPKGELRLGLISMNVVLVTGIFLTVARVPSFRMLSTTQFGILLSVKIVLFLVMFLSALIVAVYIGPRLRKKRQSPVADLFAAGMTLEQLSHFDGKDGRPAYIAYKDIIYDVSRGRLWKNGLHLMKHGAGTDLTSMLKLAPHGEDKVLAMPQVGTLVLSAEKPKQPFPLRLFYFFAYMNLVLVFVITFVIALWRWW
jgi:predicted heme/steroid binding protein/uncharacterized membrane protein